MCLCQFPFVSRVGNAEWVPVVAWTRLIASGVESPSTGQGTL